MKLTLSIDHFLEYLQEYVMCQLDLSLLTFRWINNTQSFQLNSTQRISMLRSTPAQNGRLLMHGLARGCLIFRILTNFKDQVWMRILWLLNPSPLKEKLDTNLRTANNFRTFRRSGRCNQAVNFSDENSGFEFSKCEFECQVILGSPFSETPRVL